jgi:hypothetical protein
MTNKFDEALSKERKIALYARLGEHSWFAVFEVGYVKHDEHYQPLPEGQLREVPTQGYARISEPISVNFEASDKETMVRNAIESLNAEELKIRNEMEERLAKLREQKNQLLALTHESQS